MNANDLYQNTYEPGSTFKSYGLAAAIQEGAFDPDKKYKSGHRDIMGSRISDWNRVGWVKQHETERTKVSTGLSR